MDEAAARLSRSSAIRLGVLFGVLAFCQGIGEPSDGLGTQPSWAILKRSGRTPVELGFFAALVALPWTFKPAFGLLTDFVPLFDKKRQGYLILAGGTAAVSMFGLVWRADPQTGRFPWLLGWLVASTFSWALADVVTDAFLIDRAQGTGLLGKFQATQWAAAYASGIIGGLGGGWLSEPGRERFAFWCCGLAATGTLLLACFAVREPRTPSPSPSLQGVIRTLAAATRSPTILSVGTFLFLWNFNPFSSHVLYLHLTETLGFDETFYGWTQTLMALGSIGGCATYPALSRRLATPKLVRLSILLGVASTLALGLVSGRVSAVVISLIFGVIYMTATLIQLELAARVCPPEAAGTVFAALMALENLASALSTALGGWWYQDWLGRWGAMTSFRGLVIVGAAFTAASWLLLPLLDRAGADSVADR